MSILGDDRMNIDLCNFVSLSGKSCHQQACQYIHVHSIIHSSGRLVFRCEKHKHLLEKQLIGLSELTREEALIYSLMIE